MGKMSELDMQRAEVERVTGPMMPINITKMYLDRVCQALWTLIDTMERGEQVKAAVLAADLKHSVEHRLRNLDEYVAQRMEAREKCDARQPELDLED